MWKDTLQCVVLLCFVYCAIVLIYYSHVLNKVSCYTVLDPRYPLHQLRRTCVAIAFPRIAAAARPGTWHARFKRNRKSNISTAWTRLDATRLWRCNAARHIHQYAIEAVVATQAYRASTTNVTQWLHVLKMCIYWFYYLTHPTALDPELDQGFHIPIHSSN